jgi:hypothetical protein
MRKSKGWWVDVTEHDGRKTTIGPFKTQEEAQDWAKYPVNWTVDAIVYRVSIKP